MPFCFRCCLGAQKAAPLLGLCAVLAIASALATAPAGAQPRPGRNAAPEYFPEPGSGWARRTPAQVGMNPDSVRAAVNFAVASESRRTRDLEQAHYETFGREPHGDPIGLFAPRGDATGVILRHGYIVATWGDPEAVEMTFSVTKSFLSTTVGLAYDRGLIRDLQEPVGRYAAPTQTLARYAAGRTGEGGGWIDLFDTPHNRAVTWDHLLRQTSDWEGTLWGKPDWADRPAQNPAEWRTRTRHAPGSVFEYNDVRVNVLALAALNVWRRPLPQVLREHVMDVIGASTTWRWLGYDNSWVLLDGQAVQSVSGGGHWGGGMFISAYDLARFGYLTLRRGRWGDRQVLSEAWVRLARTPTPAQPTYGFMNWYLNTDRRYLPAAPAAAFAHVGNGTNVVYVDPEHDLVIVARWIENAAVNGLVSRVIGAITPARR
jgi:CubicO group peptidase (beta-lactamase class C family)